MTTTASVLISVDEISALRQSTESKLVFIDSSFKRTDSSVPYEDFLQQRIPGAVFFDISQFTLKGSPCPPMLPSVETFNESASQLGISNDDHLIVYGVRHSPSIARVWWMFKTFQHAKVSFLIGGLEAWKEAGGDIESGEPQPRPHSEYVSPGIDRRLLATQEELLNEISDVDHESVLVDVRGGCVYESGHIPTFINIPVSHFIHDTGDYTQFKSAHEIQHLLQSYNIHPGVRTVFSCNSGMMASIATLARASIGEPTENTPMYDGSWSEWVLHPETNPIEISPPEPVV